MLITIISSIIIFIIVMPIRVFGASFASLDQKLLIQNFKFGLIEKNFGIKITEDGVEYFNLDKKAKKEIESHKVDILSILDKIKIKKLSITGCFGDNSNALNTAIVCTAINIAIPNILQLLDIKCKNTHMRIYPLYQQNILELHLNIHIKISIVLLIIMFFKLFVKKKQK